MKKSIISLLSVFVLTSAIVSFADESMGKENKMEKKTSRNALTGNTTVTKKHKRKHKMNGHTAEDTVTEKTKISKDGDTKKTTEETHDASH